MSESGLQPGQAGRTVYFKDRLVGRLSETSFGGAELPVLNGADGQPLTADALKGFGG